MHAAESRPGREWHNVRGEAVARHVQLNRRRHLIVEDVTRQFLDAEPGELRLGEPFYCSYRSLAAYLLDLVHQLTHE